MIHRGSCHCGAIRFSVEADISEAFDCNCSICKRKGHLLHMVPSSKVKIENPSAPISTYTFNKHVILHHFCPKCGVATFGQGKDPSGGDVYAINVRCLEDFDLAPLTVRHVDGRSF